MAAQLYNVHRGQNSSDTINRYEGTQTFIELENYGLAMMNKLATPGLINHCLELQNHPFKPDSQKRGEFQHLAHTYLSQECYTGYATSSAPTRDVDMHHAQKMLNSLDALEKSGLMSVEQNYEARERPVQIKSWRQRQKNKIKDLFHPGEKKAAEQLMLARRMWSHHRIFPAPGGGYPKSSAPKMEAIGRVSLAMHPDDVPRLIELMPHIFARYGAVIDHAKITEPARQHSRSESCLFYLRDLDDTNRHLSKDLLGFIQANLHAARWRPAAPGQLQISQIGRYAEERNFSGEQISSVGQRRARQVSRAMVQCFAKYGHDQNLREINFAEELEIAIIEDGYRPDNPALLVDRNNRPTSRPSSR